MLLTYSMRVWVCSMG